MLLLRLEGGEAGFEVGDCAGYGFAFVEDFVGVAGGLVVVGAWQVLHFVVVAVIVALAVAFFVVAAVGLAVGRGWVVEGVAAGAVGVRASAIAGVL